MKQNYLKQILLFVLVAILVIGGITYGIRNANNRSVAIDEPQAENQKSSSITLSIEGLYTDKHISVESNETILQMLEKLDSENTELQLSYKSYGEMGVLVESMGNSRNGTDGKYWQYTVNGTAPMIGADIYILKAEDLVEWKFKQSEF